MSVSAVPSSAWGEDCDWVLQRSELRPEQRQKSEKSDNEEEVNWMHWDEDQKGKCEQLNLFKSLRFQWVKGEDEEWEEES